MSIEDKPAAAPPRDAGRLYAPRFEAALNLLREERRAVVEVRRTILRDQDLRASDPGHHTQLCIQALREIQQLTRAIDVLDRMESGELIEVEAGRLTAPHLSGLPPIKPRQDAPARLGALRPASPPEPPRVRL